MSKGVKIAVFLTVLLMIGVIFKIGYWYMTNPSFHTTYDLNSGTLLQDISSEKAMTYEEVWRNRNELLDQEIYIRAKVVFGYYGCTLMGCLNPCCNGCMSQYYLTSESKEDKAKLDYITDSIPIEDHRDVQAREKFGCYGDECSRTCQPFLQNETYVVKGILKFDEYPKRLDKEDGHYYLIYLGHKKVAD